MKITPLFISRRRIVGYALYVWLPNDDTRHSSGNSDCRDSTRPGTVEGRADRLLADKKVDLTGINVVSNGGTVYLSGMVQSLDARQQAIKIAWEVRGVQSVVNSLEVQK